MVEPVNIDVCICTFQRASLDRCLRSVLDQNLPSDLKMRVIVADNAPKDSVSEKVAAISANSEIDVVYIHAPSRNISIARNACLSGARGDYIAFIDDDEFAPSNWLARLWADLGNNDAVFGHVVAQYPNDAPHWIVRNDFHSTMLDEMRRPFQTGYAGNVLMRWKGAPFVDERFDLSLGVSGGEDTDFFNRLHHKGAQFGSSADGFVYESVCIERLSFRWMAKRRFRSGQSFAYIAVGRTRGWALMVGALAKSIFSGFCAVVFVVSPKARGFWAMRSLFHIGVVTRSIGSRRRVPILGQNL